MSKITIRTNVSPISFLGFDLIEGQNCIPSVIKADYWGWGTYPESFTYCEAHGEDDTAVIEFEAGSTFLTWGFAKRLKGLGFFDFVVDSSMGLLMGYSPAETEWGFAVGRFDPSMSFELKTDFATTYQVVGCDRSIDGMKELYGRACAPGMEILKIEGRDEWVVPAHNPWYFREAAEVWLSFQK